MIENMRGRSTETKYGRIPLWLYEAGVSLQAIATYGWLHGKYGHFDRVVPSYATLAKELKVSRGSVIAYVKELTGAGAVRIATSGAVGQTTNTYEIAFNEPFPVPNVQVSGGQNADQVVSGLYSGGQPADQGGQRAVQEEDVFKKTKKTLSPRVPKPRKVALPTGKNERETTFSQDTNSVIAAYVTAIGRPVSPATQTKLTAQAAELLAADFPAWWLQDRARELATKGWTDLAQHCDRSTAPTVRKAVDSRSDWCGHCQDPNHRMRKDPARDNELVPCEDCHPAAVARRIRTEAGEAA